MPLVGYVCPDGERVLLSDCLANCRMGMRCGTLSTLTVISNERIWGGVPSVTQLLNGTMYEYLRLTRPYYIDPQGNAFALLGSTHHKLLADNTDQRFIAEQSFVWVGIKGTADLVEHENDCSTLFDAKTYGSFAVAKALGIVKRGKEIVCIEPDLREAMLQLNMYRVGLENTLAPLVIGRMALQVTVRDGGLKVARERGITRNMYIIEVPRLDDGEVLEYFMRKRDALLKALANNSWNEVCDERECWQGAKCRGYCATSEYCVRGKFSAC